MRNKGIFYLTIAFMIGTALDFISTIMAGDLVKTLETNLLYKYIGLWGILALNLLLIWWLYKDYHRTKTKPWTRYLLITLLVCITFIRIFVIINNLSWVGMTAESPEMLELTQNPEVLQQMKAKTVKTLAVLIYLPMIISMITYLIWRLDHHVKRKDL